MGSKRGKISVDGDLRVVVYVSRNKDNKGLVGYKSRRESYITKRTDEQIKEDFKIFVEDGVVDEVSRCYVSVNTRDEEKVKKELLIELISNDTELTTLDSKLASLAADKNVQKRQNGCLTMMMT